MPTVLSGVAFSITFHINRIGELHCVVVEKLGNLEKYANPIPEVRGARVARGVDRTEATLQTERQKCETYA